MSFVFHRFQPSPHACACELCQHPPSNAPCQTLWNGNRCCSRALPVCCRAGSRYQASAAGLRGQHRAANQSAWHGPGPRGAVTKLLLLVEAPHAPGQSLAECNRLAGLSSALQVIAAPGVTSTLHRMLPLYICALPLSAPTCMPGACPAAQGLTRAAPWHMSSSRLSTVGATGTPGGLFTTQKLASSATMRACNRQGSITVPQQAS